MSTFSSPCSTKTFPIANALASVCFAVSLVSIGEAKVFVARNIHCDPPSSSLVDGVETHTSGSHGFTVEIDQGGATGVVAVGPQPLPYGWDGAAFATPNSIVGAEQRLTDDERGEVLRLQELAGTSDSGVLSLKVAVEAATGGGLNVSGLELAVNEIGSNDGQHYLVHAVTQKDEQEVLTSGLVEASTDSDGTHCWIDLSDFKLDEVQRVEFRIYAISDSASTGLTFDEIAVHGDVIQAPPPGGLAVWTVFIAFALVIGYTAMWMWSLRTTWAMPELAEVTPVSGAAPDRGGRRFGGHWSHRTREAILDIVEAGRRRV